MVERQDIDALLISALYGELTPVEETRLAAHLESHPADRSALDDLTRAREAVQQSRILTFQYEPPQSISALLLQEASRRAPKKPAAEGEGWFARFVRSFVQHPAMAAAAMLMVVVGAATLVSRNSDTPFAETQPVETMESTSAPASPNVAIETAPNGNAVAFGSGTADTAGVAKADEFKVALADQELQKNQAESNNKAKGELAKPAETLSKEKEMAFRDDADGILDDRTGKKGGDSLAAAKDAKQKPSPDTGIELRRRDPMPKDLEEGKADSSRNERVVAAEPPADESVRGYRDQQAGGRANGAGSTTAAPGAPTGSIAPTTPAPATTAPSAGPRNAQVATPQPAPRNVSPPPPPAKTTAAPRQTIATDGTPPPTTGTAREAEKKEADKKKAPNDPNLVWAKDQHAALVTAVRGNNCGRAANIALGIANRAPSYYAQNVETDRSVKQCIAYINNEREKDAEVRASRAKKATLKNAEPAKRAADEPSRATSTDSSK